MFCLHLLSGSQFPTDNDPALLSSVSALSRCIQRGPDHIYTQNYLPCPSFPFCSLQRGRGTTCHIGGSDTDGTPDVWPKHVMGERCGIKSAADCLGCLSADEMCVWINECSRSALRKEARKNFFFFCSAPVFIFALCACVNICVSLLRFSGVA